MRELAKFSQRAARSYLQSAVFVDDHIFDQGTGLIEPVIELGPPRKRLYGKATVKNTGTQGSPEQGSEDPPFHPKDLVGSFAKEGITCALYEPKKGFATDPESELFKLCERPDIIILDWDFSGDGGSSALDLITCLIKQSSEDFPHHTRLISIYTADQSLVGVANKLADRLRKEGLEAHPDNAQCRLRCGATRVLVLGKPISRFGEEEESFTVKERDLANRLIDEFVGMNSGILPAFALHGLASIRRHSKRILDRFHGDLDGAFLFHRCLVADSEEAFDQLPDLLADEIRAVVEDDRISIAEIKKIAADALKNEHITASDKKLIDLLLKGAKAKTVLKNLNGKDGVPLGHLSLAALFSSRTQYSSAARQLCFGTVVRLRKKHSRYCSYAVCLVPACDSLRLKGATVQFPFWSVDIEDFDGGHHRNGMILETKIGEHVALSAGGKAGEKLWTASFDVDLKSKTVLALRSGKTYKYSGCEKTVEWVGQLKPLHAHRIARSITESLARVGVSEAEWIRVFCDRE